MVTKIGHRGAMGYAPENTLNSFQKALELKVDVIELDVHICKSGELVVIHDSKVDRTTNGKGYVLEKTLAELKKLKTDNNQRIPTLIEALDLIERKAIINIELKATGTAKPVVKLIEDYVINKSWQYDDFTISSFNHYELKELKEVNPKIKIGALMAGIPIGFAEFGEKIKADSVNLDLEFINQEFVDDAHQRGLKVYVRTVNDLNDIAKMKNFNVDGICSNFPDKL